MLVSEMYHFHRFLKCINKLNVLFSDKETKLFYLRTFCLTLFCVCLCTIADYSL